MAILRPSSDLVTGGWTSSPAIVTSKQPWASQPQVVVGVVHPLLGGLNAATETLLSGTKVVTPYGIAADIAGVSATTTIANSQLAKIPHAGDLTVYIEALMSWGGTFALRIGANDGNNGLSVWKGNNNGNVYGLVAGYSYNPATLSALDYSAGLTRVRVVAKYKSGASPTISVEAFGRGAPASASLTGTYAAPNARVVKTEVTVSGGTDRIVTALVFEGDMPSVMLFQNPWQIFRPRKRVSYFLPPLYDTLDETTASDSDYIETTGTGNSSIILLGSGSDPGNDNNHKLSYRASSTSETLNVDVVQMAPAIITSKQPWRRQPQAPVKVNSSLSIAHAWALNVSGGRSIIDSAGNANGVFGVGTGGTTGNYWVVGNDGWEIRYDNSGTGTTESTKLLVGNGSGSAGPQNTTWSFECNILFASSAHHQTIFGGSTAGIHIRITTSGAIELLKQATASVGTSSGVLTSGNRYRIGITYNGTTAKFYINGNLSGSSSSAQTFTHAQYCLGWAPGIPAEYLDNGNRLAGVVITNRVLSDVEILSRKQNPNLIFRPRKKVSYFDAPNVIATRTPSLTSSPADYSIDLTSGEAATITDYTKLGLRFRT